MRRPEMGAAYFYHLTRRPLEATLPVLLDKALAAGWRVVVRGRDRAMLAQLDQHLWTSSDDGFLPHGLAGGPNDAAQPVLLTTGTAVENDPQCLMIVDRADVTVDEVMALERVCILFDGNDPDALGTARTLWKTLTTSGCAAQYWSEEAGRWEKKAEASHG